MKLTGFFALLLVIKAVYGVDDGMVACAWGKAKYSFVDDILNKFNVRATNFAVSDKDVKFFLYKKEAPYPYQIFLNDKNRLTSGNFDVTKETKIIIHGYRSSRDSNSIKIPTEAFLKSGDFNIIAVDWNRAQHWGVGHALPSTYPDVVKKLNSIANYVTKMISFLESYGMNLKTTTIVGHSLGAHVAGVASHILVNKVGHIVGLDPAAPYFHNKGPGDRLSKNDADRVDVIHTEMDQCGLRDQLGHYDFYPNSGIKQPGCDKNKCSHSRSYRYFAESLTTTVGFYAKWCADWKSMQQGNCDGELALMGGLTYSPMKEGIYYVKTNDKEPFALGRGK